MSPEVLDPLPAASQGPLSKLVDEADSKSAAADPASRFESGEGHSVARPPADVVVAAIFAAGQTLALAGMLVVVVGLARRRRRAVRFR